MVDEIDTASTQGRRVLTLDGGGIKGVFIAAFLAELERFSKTRMIDQFDLIAGTSTGGIVALGLGAGMSAAEILAFYEGHGPAIFPRRSLLRQITRAKYDPAPLKAALGNVFGERKLGHSLTRMLIPSMSLTTGEVHVYKTSHLERYFTDYNVGVVDVALATSAAPTFFPTHTSELGVPLIDGGVWANNPMGLAAVEAVGVLGWSPAETRLLSIGCTQSPSNLTDNTKRGHGYAYWARRVSDMFMTAQSSASVGTAQHLLDRHNVHRVSPTVDAGHYSLDDVGAIDSLKALAVECARAEAPRIIDGFLTGEREPFVPYREVDR